MDAQTHRGFALILAVILTSVALAIGLALLDVAYKQVLIATTAKQSGIAFYNADSAMECALYNDQVNDTFNYNNSVTSTITCNNLSVTVTPNNASSPHIRTFTVPCATGGISGSVTVYKYSSAVTNIFASGYNTCNTSDPRRVERGLKISI